MENKVSYAIAMNIYRALGGELSGFDSVEEVYAAIDAIYAESDGRIKIEPLSTTVTGAGTYRYDSEDITGYKPVEVTVDVKEGYDYSGLGYSDEFIDKIIKYEKGYIEESKQFYSDETNYRSSADDYFPLYLPAGKPIKYAAAYPSVIYNHIFTETNVSNNANYNVFNDNKYKNLLLVGKIEFPNWSSNLNFGYSWKLKEVEEINFPIGSSISFAHCYRLEKIGKIIAPSVSTLTFDSCYNLKSIDEIEVGSNLTSASDMFHNCGIKKPPYFDTSNVTNMSDMFYWNLYGTDSSLEEIPQYNTSKVSDASQMFNGCVNLKTLPELDFSNVRYASNCLSNCVNLTNLGGFKNYGMNQNLSTNGSLNIRFDGKDNLTHDSIMNVINNLYDRAAAGYSIITLYFGNNLYKISAEEIAIATNKGWTLQR